MHPRAERLGGRCGARGERLLEPRHAPHPPRARASSSRSAAVVRRPSSAGSFRRTPRRCATGANAAAAARARSTAAAAASAARPAAAASARVSSARRCRCASSSSSTASAVSPANQSSPRTGSQPRPSRVTAGTGEASSCSGSTTGQRRDELARVATDEHDERAEPGLACPVEQLEPAGRVVGHDRGCEPAERGGDRTLVAGLDVERREREPLALLCERAGRGRQALALGERLLQRGEALRRERRPRLQVVPLAHRGAGRGVGVVGGTAELGEQGLRVAPTARRRVPAEVVAQPLHRLLPHTQPLRELAQPEERAGAAGGEVALDRGALSRQLRQIEVGEAGALARGDPRPALLGLELEARSAAS